MYSLPLRRTLLIALGAGAVPMLLHAQQGYLFKSPVVTVSLRAGAAFPAANDEIHRFFTDTLTLERKDFNSSIFGGDVGIRLNDRMELVVGVSHARVKKQSEFQNWVHDDATDSPIEQTTTIRRTPVTVGARYYLMDRGRKVGSLAWVPTSFSPYLGAGVGRTWYTLEQEGEFVDVDTFDIFADQLHSSGSSDQLHLFGGAEWWAHPQFGITAEAKYLWGSAPLHDSYRAFKEINLRGFQITAGFATRF
jgi:hypothetical protein